MLSKIFTKRDDDSSIVVFVEINDPLTKAQFSGEVSAEPKG